MDSRRELVFVVALKLWGDQSPVCPSLVTLTSFLPLSAPQTGGKQVPSSGSGAPAPFVGHPLVTPEATEAVERWLHSVHGG